MPQLNTYPSQIQKDLPSGLAKEEHKTELFVRNYEPRDREAVRWLCCETGFLGNPIDPVFEDREIFADFHTSYYTDVEPESAFVLEHEGKVKGYLLGSRKPFLHQLYSLVQNVTLFFRVMQRYSTYNRATRDFIGWVLRNSWREVPAAPRRVAHFHFNLLPEVQGIGGGRLLLRRYFDYLLKHGEKRVYGQLVTFEGRRGSRLFERYGFKVLSKREITKYRQFHPEPVYLTTVIKELEDGKSI